jgi:hypothetical protein
MPRFIIMRLTQAIKIGKADITFCSESILSRVPFVIFAYHDGSRIADDLARPIALPAHPPGIALVMLVGYSLGMS